MLFISLCSAEDHGETNLALLRRVLLTYIWENLDDGYTQGMCDVVAPILALVTTESGLTMEVVEVTTYAYFRHLLQMRLGKLFTYAHSSTLMDENFSRLRTLVHVVDNKLIRGVSNMQHSYFDHGGIVTGASAACSLTYIWENLDDGYTQGMCDVVAPILALVTTESGLTMEVVEVTTYAYFRHLLQMRLGKLFTYAHSSTLMDENFSRLRTLVHVSFPWNTAS
ncbi:hypothetical protein AHF37_12790 [Paragonimus kellicotti]|nr:hypothetical protein AHF37_12790 [Paragonimus kellicotti]